MSLQVYLMIGVIWFCLLIIELNVLNEGASRWPCGHLRCMMWSLLVTALLWPIGVLRYLIGWVYWLYDLVVDE